jgi:hypothetical protein
MGCSYRKTRPIIELPAWGASISPEERALLDASARALGVDADTLGYAYLRPEGEASSGARPRDGAHA